MKKHLFLWIIILFIVLCFILGVILFFSFLRKEPNLEIKPIVKTIELDQSSYGDKETVLQYSICITIENLPTKKSTIAWVVAPNSKVNKNGEIIYYGKETRDIFVDNYIASCWIDLSPEFGYGPDFYFSVTVKSNDSSDDVLNKLKNSGIALQCSVLQYEIFDNKHYKDVFIPIDFSSVNEIK